MYPSFDPAKRTLAVYNPTHKKIVISHYSQQLIVIDPCISKEQLFIKKDCAWATPSENMNVLHFVIIGGDALVAAVTETAILVYKFYDFSLVSKFP